MKLIIKRMDYFSRIIRYVFFLHVSPLMLYFKDYYNMIFPKVRKLNPNDIIMSYISAFTGRK